MQSAEALDSYVHKSPDLAALVGKVNEVSGAAAASGKSVEPINMYYTYSSILVPTRCVLPTDSTVHLTQPTNTPSVCLDSFSYVEKYDLCGHRLWCCGTGKKKSRRNG